MQSTLQHHAVPPSSSSLGKRNPGPVYLPSKRLRSGHGDYASNHLLHSPLAAHFPPRKSSDGGVMTTVVLTPQKRRSGRTAARPNAKRSDPVGRFKAEKWFEDANKNASGMKNVPFRDDDPPFYIRRQPSSGGDSGDAVRSDGPNLLGGAHGPSTTPSKSLLARMELGESNSSDFRSVIDDLTVQNQKLKKKLKKYEKLHCSHMQEEKLFEVRIHGLAVHRKRELEETLRKFVSSVEAELPETSARIVPIQPSTPADPIVPKHKPSSSSTSASKQLDSAYASMPGQPGVAHSQVFDQNVGERIGPVTQSRQQIVTSYLHDIPDSLMPKHSMGMSDRVKSKLVVKRLEQIFTGKAAASRRYNQSHQQQEVSQLAARDDRQEARGRRNLREGLREARILPSDAELQVETMSETNLAAPRPRRSSNDGGDSVLDTNASRDITPEQRPTRPLDLDLHRAQVPSDNIDYIRHLGLVSPKHRSNETSEENAWVYLNLLINMAQLHTLNVTPEFIKHAIAEVSCKFELSVDGTKIRWQGGTEGTRMSSDSDESESVTNSKSTGTSHALSKRGSFANLSEEPNSLSERPLVALESSAASEIGAKRRPVALGQLQDGGRFQYKPLFFHTASSDEDNDSAQTTETSSTSWQENGTAFNSGLNSGSHGIRESEARLRNQNHGNGPIIFYHKARFCTDLSGDGGSAMIDTDAYRRYTEQPIGCSPIITYDEENDHTNESVFTGQDSICPDVKSHVSARSALDLEDLKSSISDCDSSPILMNMEASGLGGIQPEDNFVVKVQVRHDDKLNRQACGQLSPFSSPRGPVRRMLHKLPQSALDNFREETKDIPRSQPRPLRREIISAVKRNLPPSSLPRPSYKFSTSEDDDDDDDDDDEQRSEENEACSAIDISHLASPQYSISDPARSRPADYYMESSLEIKESSYFSTASDTDDDSSIDLLAQARILDPDFVAAQEREFDSHLPRPSARVVPSKWGAATTGAASENAHQQLNQQVSDVDSMSVDANANSVFGKSI